MNYWIRHPDGRLEQTDDPMRFAMFFESDSRRIALDVIGPYQVSTVFLGIDHGYSSEGPPILFETMIFGKDSSGEFQYRYSTEEEAREGHNLAVTRLKELCERSLNPGVYFPGDHK